RRARRSREAEPGWEIQGRIGAPNEANCVSGRRQEMPARLRRCRTTQTKLSLCGTGCSALRYTEYHGEVFTILYLSKSIAWVTIARAKSFLQYGFPCSYKKKSYAMRSSYCILAALLAASANAQAPPGRAIGAVTAVDAAAKQITLKTDTGE